MNGRDIFLALDFIGEDLVEQAEFDAFPAQRRRLRPLLAAALIAVLLLAGCAVAYTQGWFADFFQEASGGPLTPGQMGYLQEHEQIIAQTQTHDGWTMELRSALNDGTTAYIILGVTAPEGTDLDPRMDGDQQLDFFGPGNTRDLITCTIGVDWDLLHLDWMEDGDGLEHTRNLVIQMDPKRGKLADPFGTKAVYHIAIENIVCQSTNQTYYQHLMDTKYKGQTDIMFTHEETLRLHPTEVLAEGVWEFDLTLNREAPKIELLSKPIPAQACQRGTDDRCEMMDVTLTSVILRPLSISLHCSSSASYPSFATEDNQVFAVRKDGSQIRLWPGGAQGRLYQELKAETPLIFDEIDHILLADGTVIPAA